MKRCRSFLPYQEACSLNYPDSKISFSESKGLEPCLIPSATADPSQMCSNQWSMPSTQSSVQHLFPANIQDRNGGILSSTTGKSVKALTVLFVGNCNTIPHCLLPHFSIILSSQIIVWEVELESPVNFCFQAPKYLIDSDTVNICIQAFVWIPVFTFYSPQATRI